MAETVAGVILAGGRARRMGGGDKSLLPLGGRPLLAHVIARLRPQVAALVLNANGDPARFAGFGLPIVADAIGDHPGPLAGILAGLDWARAHAPDARWLLSAPTDTPFLPDSLVSRLRGAVRSGEGVIACATSRGRTHPVVALWPVALADDLRRALVEEGVRKVDGFNARYRTAAVDFAAEPVDPFLNINTPDDLENAARLAR
jgi:molybdopterin-guanine dinucleotide biosynthesis protein A